MLYRFQFSLLHGLRDLFYYTLFFLEKQLFFKSFQKIYTTNSCKLQKKMVLYIKSLPEIHGKIFYKKRSNLYDVCRKSIGSIERTKSW